MAMHTRLGLCSMLKSINMAQVPQAQWPQRMGSDLVNSHIFWLQELEAKESVNGLHHLLGCYFKPTYWCLLSQ